MNFETSVLLSVSLRLDVSVSISPSLVLRTAPIVILLRCSGPLLPKALPAHIKLADGTRVVRS